MIERPGGRRFGALVHGILAVVDLMQRAEIGTASRFHGRFVGATETEIEAAATTVITR